MAGEAITVLFSTYQPDIKSVHVECLGRVRYIVDSGVLLEEGGEENAQGQAVLLEGPTGSGHQDPVKLDSRTQVCQQEEEQRVACEQRQKTRGVAYVFCLVTCLFIHHVFGSLVCLLSVRNRTWVQSGQGPTGRLLPEGLQSVSECIWHCFLDSSF